MARAKGIESEDHLPEVRAPGGIPAESPERAGTEEERGRHQRFAHEPYSGSGQGRHGAPTAESLPLEKSKQGGSACSEDTTMPWPADEAVEHEQRRDGARPRGRVNPAHRDTRRHR